MTNCVSSCMTHFLHVPSTLPELGYNRKPAPNLMFRCNATAGQKILSMLPSFRRIMTTALFPLFSMTMWSLQYQAERTLSAFFHTMDCIRSWKRTEMVEHHASQDLSVDSVGLVAPLASSQLGTLLFWKNRWAGSFRFGIVLITSYCILLHLITSYYILLHLVTSCYILLITSY